MKGIAIFVALLLAGLGVATYLSTRTPHRTLSPSDRSWVTRYRSWTAKNARLIDVAYTGMGDSVKKNARLLDPLLTCFATLTGVGEPPSFLKRVEEAAQTACGEAQFATQLNDKYATASLATTKQHLARAEDGLQLGLRRLRDELEPS